ncbi:hypothetical protein [Marininema halotolerans]|uniref:Uncharacterized protein n=1 Tax=Marininema halotolerans TaxID=1155944 RepID=A0A1I6RLG0_9BACL|nr:hypothetical protein [Marininema halotolerans]SFS65535.1 hypothetical protein SAMN05444972_105181 [Marininema halotolerans]
MNLQIDLTEEEWETALRCFRQRYEDLHRKVLVGQGKGWYIQQYQKEAHLLEKLIIHLTKKGPLS